MVVKLAVAVHENKSNLYSRGDFRLVLRRGVRRETVDEIITMTSRLTISYFIFSQYSKIPVTYQISLLGQKAPANKVGVVGNGLIFFT
jgi:hypothetical protein